MIAGALPKLLAFHFLGCFSMETASETDITCIITCFYKFNKDQKTDLSLKVIAFTYKLCLPLNLPKTV